MLIKQRIPIDISSSVSRHHEWDERYNFTFMSGGRTNTKSNVQSIIRRSPVMNSTPGADKQ